MASRRTGLASLVICSLILAVVPEGAAQDKEVPDLGKLSWMVGSWSDRKGDVDSEEHWIAPKGGVMLGLARTVRGDKGAFFEFLRIARTSSRFSYFASPQGRPATEFPLLELGDKKVVFENLKHDFPQRISYWLAADGALHARIEGEVKGKKRQQEWRWLKAR